MGRPAGFRRRANAGAFISYLGAALSTAVESNLVTLANLTGPGSLTIGGGSYSKNGGAYTTAATTVANGDTLKVRLTSSASYGAMVSATVTIDGSQRIFSVTTAAASGQPTVTISGAQSKAEGNSGATLFTYTVTRSASAGTVSVPWSFTPGNTSADDFTGGTYPAGGNVTMADGVSSGTFSVSVNGDTTVEPDETFTVLISTPAGYAPDSATSSTGTILNDDVASSGVVGSGFWNDAATWDDTSVWKDAA